MIDILNALQHSFEEVHYMDFYRDIFPIGELEEKGVYEVGKYAGIAVTPRNGKPVEINAMWYNALKIMQELATRNKEKDKAKTTKNTRKRKISS